VEILVIGSGAREHAIAWAISKNAQAAVLPGNPGMAMHAQVLGGSASDFEHIYNVATGRKIEYVIVGPETPLCNGLADFLIERGLKVFGPKKQGATLEGSKAWAKDFMCRNDIPQAGFESFQSASEAIEFVKKHEFPQVIKMDGLASGKGVHIVEDFREAEIVIKAILSENKFGQSGKTIVIEEFLTGKELTVMFLTDGRVAKPLLPARDHKRLEDGDKGPMTGGMGAFSPVPDVDSQTLNHVKVDIIDRTLAGLQKESIDYQGVVYCGLMLTKSGPKVLEYNCRFGDPEAQVVLSQLSTPLSEIIDAVTSKELDKIPIVFKQGFSACVVIASEGYPIKPIIGREIFGFEQVSNLPNAVTFSAGVGQESGKLYTDGGRVFSCVGFGPTLRMALGRAYGMVGNINFEGMIYRGDIGGRFGRGRTSMVSLRESTGT